MGELMNKAEFFNAMNMTYTDKINRVTGADGSAMLEIYQQYSIVDGAAGTHEVILPSVAEAVGRTYTILCPDSTADVTVVDNDDSLDWTDVTLDTDDDFIVVFSDGQKWHVIESDVA